MRYAQNWLIKELENLFEEHTGAKFEEEEQEFIINFFDTRINSEGKVLYYKSVFKFRRDYPKFIISWSIKRSLKQAFIKENAPESLIRISDIFAKKLLFDAMKIYCKIAD